MEPQRWAPFLVLIFVIGGLINLPVLMALPVMMGVVMIVARWWRNHSLENIIYLRKPFYTRGFPGERIDIRLDIENRKFLPVLWLRIRDRWPKAVSPLDQTAMSPSHHREEGHLDNVFSLRWFERAQRRYTLELRKRGVYSLGPARLDSGDLFGIYDLSRTIRSVERLTVFPALIPFEAFRLPTDDPFGDRTSRRTLYDDPTRPIGVREYRPEDDFRRVHWPATAHTGQLQSKVFQPISARVLIACLNVSTFERHWEGTNPALLEFLISACAAVVKRGLEDGYRVGLISNGCLANSDQSFRVLPSRSPRQLGMLLETLAAVTPLVTAPFERFLIKELPSVPYRATLVVLTTITPPALMETLLRVKRHNRIVTLFAFAEEPPPSVPGLNIFHIPFRENEFTEASLEPA